MILFCFCIILSAECAPVKMMPRARAFMVTAFELRRDPTHSNATMRMNNIYIFIIYFNVGYSTTLSHYGSTRASVSRPKLDRVDQVLCTYIFPRPLLIDDHKKRSPRLSCRQTIE
jgi:hypothetical protein